MVKIALVTFNSNIAYGIGGGRREDFKKGDKVIVGNSDILPLMRLGCTIEDEVVLSYKEHKSLFATKQEAKKWNKSVEAPAETETPAE